MPLTQQAITALKNLRKDFENALAVASSQDLANSDNSLDEGLSENPASRLVVRAADEFDAYCQNILAEMLAQSTRPWRHVMKRITGTREEALESLRAHRVPAHNVRDALRLDLAIPWNSESRIIVALRDQIVKNGAFDPDENVKSLIDEVENYFSNEKANEGKFPWPEDLLDTDRPIGFGKKGRLDIHEKAGAWAVCHVRDHIQFMDGKVAADGWKTTPYRSWKCSARAKFVEASETSTEPVELATIPTGDSDDANENEIEDKSAQSKIGGDGPPRPRQIEDAMASITPFEFAKLALDLKLGRVVRQCDFDAAYDLLEDVVIYIAKRKNAPPKMVSFDEIINEETSTKRDRKGTGHHRIAAKITSIPALLVRLKTVFPTEIQREEYPDMVRNCMSELHRINNWYPNNVVEGPELGWLEEKLAAEGRSMDDQAAEDAFVEIGITEMEEAKRRCLRHTTKIRALEDILQSKALIWKYETDALRWACHEGAEKTLYWEKLPEFYTKRSEDFFSIKKPDKCSLFSDVFSGTSGNLPISSIVVLPYYSVVLSVTTEPFDISSGLVPNWTRPLGFVIIPSNNFTISSKAFPVCSEAFPVSSNSLSLSHYKVFLSIKAKRKPMITRNLIRSRERNALEKSRVKPGEQEGEPEAAVPKDHGNHTTRPCDVDRSPSFIDR